MPAETTEELLQKLVESLRDLLDESLILAIASDHDLQKKSDYDSVRETLQGLAQNVDMEEATGFNPSGTSGAVGDDALDNSSLTETTNSQKASHNRETETSNSDLASLSASSAYSTPQLTAFNDDSEESKVLQLKSMFAELKEYDIKYSLKKADGDFQTALDDLLNIQFLSSTGQLQKGVDGFFQPDNLPSLSKRRKGKNKGKKTATPNAALQNGDGTLSPDDSKELKHQDEISYLVNRFDLPFNEISDIYYEKRCTIGLAALEILDRHILLGIEAQDDAGKKAAQELELKYRNVPEKYMSTIVQVTGSIPESSDDIASLLSKHFAKNPWTQKLDLNYTLTPLPKEDIEGLETVTYGKVSPNKSGRSTPLAMVRSSNASHAEAAEKVNQYRWAKREASDSAAQLTRRGASSPLYRQAAGFYADRAREQGRYLQQATSAAADVLVQEQSTTNSIDLHGVYVQDGVRIARQRVHAWWTGLGEFRSDKARQQPFTVITGLGRHSAGGVSQMRQAVAAALLQDGWKIQVETGRFVVKGRR